MVQVMDVHQKSQETRQPVLHVADLDKSYITLLCIKKVLNIPFKHQYVSQNHQTN